MTRSISNSTLPVLSDIRLVNRFQQVVKTIEQKPAGSFPSLFVKKSALEGFYRLMNNKKMDYQEVICAACSDTVRETQQESLVLAIHDTTQFSFPEEWDIEGVGRLTREKAGFFGHFCIGVNLEREIIGLLGLKPWIRTDKLKGKRNHKELREDPENEKLRWRQMMTDVQEKLHVHQNVIHVADREADSYRTFSELINENIRFVLRVSYDRNIQDKEFHRLFDSLQAAPLLCEREVHLTARKPAFSRKDNKTHPPRKRRIAKLGVSGKRIEISRSLAAGFQLPRSLTLNFVRVFELETPVGDAPIEWRLVTTEPIETEQDLLRIVDIYRTRWVIEEYFKALKSGCNFEKRGFESLHALLNCLAIFAPIGCRLYNIKMLGRNQPNRSTMKLANPIQIKILAHQTQQSEQSLQSAGAFMGAVAQLGGHIKYNGLPGWQVLARGYEKLLQLEEGWRIATSPVNPKNVNPLNAAPRLL
jgi:hypothetical protein